MIRQGLVIVTAALVLGCSGGSDDEKPEGAIPEHQLEALKKAENVEDVLQQADQQRREQTDKQ